MPTKTLFVGARPPVIDFIPGFYEFRREVRHGGNDQMLALRMPRLRKNLVLTLNEQNATIFSGTTPERLNVHIELVSEYPHRRFCLFAHRIESTLPMEH